MLFLQRYARSLDSQRIERTIQQLAAEAGSLWNKLAEEEKDVYRDEADLKLHVVHVTPPDTDLTIKLE